MNTRQLLVTGIFACVACAPEAPVPAQSATPAAPQRVTTTAAVATPHSANGLGTIEGKVAANPWHAIKDSGVVYLEDGPKDTKPVASETLDNHDMEFVPKVVVVPAGGSVLFTNTDPMMHNVFTPDGDQWNLGQIPQNGTAVKQFDKPQIYTVLCNLHPSMIAYLVVSPSRYFARTDPDGAFAIKDVPPGTYHVTAWLPRLKPVTQVVTLTGDEVAVNFSLRR